MSERDRPEAQAFHLAFRVDDLEATRAFYADLLGCPLGRASDRWIDFDFFGHQITAHRVDPSRVPEPKSDVDGDAVPIPHFGAVLEWSAWEALASRLREADQPFLLGPRVRFEGQVGEQGTFFVRDPAGNALEFKSFRDPKRLFAH